MQKKFFDVIYFSGFFTIMITSLYSRDFNGVIYLVDKENIGHCRKHIFNQNNGKENNKRVNFVYSVGDKVS